MINLKYTFFLLLFLNVLVSLWSLRGGQREPLRHSINSTTDNKQILLVGELAGQKLQAKFPEAIKAESKAGKKSAAAIQPATAKKPSGKVSSKQQSIKQEPKKLKPVSSEPQKPESVMPEPRQSELNQQESKTPELKQPAANNSEPKEPELKASELNKIDSKPTETIVTELDASAPETWEQENNEWQVVAQDRQAPASIEVETRVDQVSEDLSAPVSNVVEPTIKEEGVTTNPEPVRNYSIDSEFNEN